LGDLWPRNRIESKRESFDGVEGILLSEVVVVRDVLDVAYVSADEILGRDRESWASDVPTDI